MARRVKFVKEMFLANKPALEKGFEGSDVFAG